MALPDSLPYIDPDITVTQRSAAEKLIRGELPQQTHTVLHPSITEQPTSRLNVTQQQEINRAGAKEALIGGVDLSRYETFDEPTADTDPESLENALRIAYANITYLKGRQANIALLEDYGKNAWLIGNSHLEDVLKRLEAELKTAKEQCERINRSRKANQEASRGELLGLEDTWKQGIGRIIETQLATDRLKSKLQQGELSVPDS